MKYLALRPLALASLIGNVVLIVTGGAVRLTGSGLGCPTWPKCTDGSYTTTEAMGAHGVIEFGNRTLTFILAAIAVACVVVAWRELPATSLLRLRGSWGRRRAGASRFWLSVAVLGGIPAQAVLGGITVLTHLNPWVVSSHFLLSLVLVTLAYALWRRTVEGDGTVRRLTPAPLRHLAMVLTGAAAAVIVAGAIVTGSGPHAGDEKAKRTGLDPAQVAQAHADLVFLVIGLTVALWFALLATRGPAKAVRTLLIVELAQGLIGFVQYFTHLPIALVAAHMLGAGLMWTATLAVVWSLREREATVAAPAVVAMPEPAAVN